MDKNINKKLSAWQGMDSHAWNRIYRSLLDEVEGELEAISDEWFTYLDTGEPMTLINTYSNPEIDLVTYNERLKYLYSKKDKYTAILLGRQSNKIVSASLTDILDQFSIKYKRFGKKALFSLRDEKQPSCYADCEKNVWFDFGTQEGGGTVLLYSKLTGKDSKESYKDLLNLF